MGEYLLSFFFEKDKEVRSQEMNNVHGDPLNTLLTLKYANTFSENNRKNIEFVCKMPKIFLGLQSKTKQRPVYHFMTFYDLSYPLC